MKHRLNDLTNLLHRRVESAHICSHSKWLPLCVKNPVAVKQITIPNGMGHIVLCQLTILRAKNSIINLEM